MTRTSISIHLFIALAVIFFGLALLRECVLILACEEWREIPGEMICTGDLVAHCRPAKECVR